MKNSNQTFKKGYGKFPYIIERLSSGVYRQIPVVFDTEKSNKKVLGIKFIISEKHSVIKIEDLILLHKDSLVDITKNFKKELEKKEKIKKRICIVLGPKMAIYFEDEDEIIESNSIPIGGWLWGKENETITESKFHYDIYQESNFKEIDKDILNFEIDEKKLQLISKEDPYRIFIFEKMWAPKTKNGVNWLRKMIENSENNN
ncbi:MAG: hypothetical protein ACJ0QH_04650 [Flavobacteriales bacterium]